MVTASDRCPDPSFVFNMYTDGIVTEIHLSTTVSKLHACLTVGIVYFCFELRVTIALIQGIGSGHDQFRLVYQKNVQFSVSQFIPSISIQYWKR